MTERDYKILQFLEICPSNSVLIADYLGASKQVIQRRLQKLYENDKVKRGREDINSYYIYYVDGKCPKNLNHMLMLSKLYIYWTKKGYEILKFKREVLLCKGIKADGLAVVKRGNGVEVIAIEADIWTNPSHKVIKYTNNKQVLINTFGQMPQLLFITNKSVKSKEIEVDRLRLDFYD